MPSIYFGYNMVTMKIKYPGTNIIILIVLLKVGPYTNFFERSRLRIWCLSSVTFDIFWVCERAYKGVNLKYRFDHIFCFYLSISQSIDQVRDRRHGGCVNEVSIPWISANQDCCIEMDISSAHANTKKGTVD